MVFNPGPYLKAIVAGTLAGLGTLYAAQADGVITGQEWTQVAIYTISAAAAIYGVPNTPATKQDNTPQQQTPASSYLPPAPATQWPAAAIAALPAPPAGYPEPGTTPADTAALAASAAARQGVGA